MPCFDPVAGLRQCGVAGVDGGVLADDASPAAGDAPPTGVPLSRRLRHRRWNGALCGAILFGTANALLSGERAIGFSMVGGIASAIAQSTFKHMAGVTGSTGIAFAAPFCATVAVGRWAAFLRASPISPMARRLACRGASIRRRHVAPPGAALRMPSR